MGFYTSNKFFYKPEMGATGTDEKNKFDSGLDIIDARLGKEIWVGDPGLAVGFQVFGDGNNDDYPYFNALLTDIGTKETTLVVPKGTYKFNNDITFPANVHLVFRKGAKLKPGAVSGAGTGTNTDVTASGTITASAGSVQVTRSSGTTAIEVGSFLIANPGTGEERREVKFAPISTTPELWTAFSGALSAATYKVSSRTITFSASHNLEVGDFIYIGGYSYIVLKRPSTTSIEISRHPAACFSGQSYSRSARVKINGTLQAGHYQIFECLGVNAGVIKFNRGAVEFVRPEWWGAQADGLDASAAVNTNAMEKAMWCWQEDTTPPYTYKNRMVLSNGRYVLNDTLYFVTNTHLTGQGPSNDFREGTILALKSNVNRHLMEDVPTTALSEQSIIEKIKLLAGTQTVSVNGMSFSHTSHGMIIQYCGVDGFQVADDSYGIFLSNSPSARVLYTTIGNCSNGLYIGTDSFAAFNDISFRRFYGIRVNGGDVRLMGNKVYGDNPQSGYTSLAALYVRDTAQVTVIGNAFDHCDHGIHIYNGGGTFTGNVITYQRSHGVNTEYHLYNFLFQGNYVVRCGCGPDKTIGTADDAGYGLNLGATWYSDGLITGNLFKENGSGPVNLPATTGTTTGNFQLPLMERNVGIDIAPQMGTYLSRDYNLPALTQNNIRPNTFVGSRFRTANTSSTDIINLGGGTPGKEVIIEIRDSNSAIRSLSSASNIYTYQVNRGTPWSSDVKATTAWDYFHDTPVASNDAIYWGYESSVNAGTTINEKFGAVSLKVGTAFNGAGVTIAWEVWNGSAWVAVDAVSEGNPFSSTGEKTIRFIPPATWTKCNLSTATGVPSGGPSVNRYWLRARLTALTSATEGGANADVVSKISLIRLNAASGDFGPLSAGQVGTIKLLYNGWWWEEQSRSIN